LEKPAAASVESAATAAPAVPQAEADTGSVQSEEAKLFAALQRELSRRGYKDQMLSAPNGLRLAVLAYEFDNGLPLSGAPSPALLKHILFDVNQAPRGAFADRAELNGPFILQVQKRLLELGFFSGPLSGRADVWTINAIKAFERYRHIPVTGRLTEATLLDLIDYSGKTIEAPPARAAGAE
jgi:hypothetical protein